MTELEMNFKVQKIFNLLVLSRGVSRVATTYLKNMEIIENVTIQYYTTGVGVNNTGIMGNGVMCNLADGTRGKFLADEYPVLKEHTLYCDEQITVIHNHIYSDLELIRNELDNKTVYYKNHPYTLSTTFLNINSGICFHLVSIHHDHYITYNDMIKDGVLYDR